MGGLLSTMKQVTVMRMMDYEGRALEKEVLTTDSVRMREVGSDRDDRVSIDQSASFLGMSKRAFNLMVAANRYIFRKVAIYDGMWYLPGLYLKDIHAKGGFPLVKGKYELLAKDTPRQTRSS